MKLIPMFLIDPYLDQFPIGVYDVSIEEHGFSIYKEGRFHYHDASRFIEPSSLLLELF